MNIVPTYPIRILPQEDYFNNYLIYTFGDLPSTDKVKYFRNPVELFKAIPDYEPLFCHGMNLDMIMLYSMLKGLKRFKELVPHTSFGKYHPWGFPVNMFRVLKPLMEQFDNIRATTPYEYDYFISRGLKQAYYLPLHVHRDYFAKLGLKRNRNIENSVLCMAGTREVKNVDTIIKACEISKSKLTILENVIPGSIEFDNAFIENSIFVNSSYQEGFAIGVAEANAARMKLCLSDIPTLRSQYECRALFHKPDDHKKLAENISSCLRVQ